ncbi:lipase family alpha/beta hydrolase [Streptomyces sp. NPDC086023]|uniref:lipase family alpha/beta hydrolase n=1 Tax=Streptomyces sp. NPDC086023 TaxID=3365746 RepID=UPI0037D36895
MTNRPRPLILIRGFGGPDLQDEQRNVYQGFNDGTCYPGRRGESYLYEGFVLRCLKSARHPYRDATNVVGYYKQEQKPFPDTEGWPEDLLRGSVIVDVPMARSVLAQGVAGTMWVYRFYDLVPRTLERYGEGLVKLLKIIEEGARRAGEEFTGVDVVAHSMGGLVLRAALTRLGGRSEDLIHRIVTLGTPHRGIAFQLLPAALARSLPLGVADEIAAFDPRRTDILGIPFPAHRILTVVGTNYEQYANGFANLGNRLSTLIDEGTLAYNRSDGLVKHASAQIPGAPRTFVNKCHGGQDSLVTSREAYEIAMRFFHGTHRVRLRLARAEVKRGHDIFGKSEFFFGVSIKPRYVDFELFHQSKEAENCYGPFHTDDFSDPLPDLATELSRPLSESGDATTGWAGPGRLVWEGWVDASAKPAGALDHSLVLRLEVYVGERDSFGVGFSDNLVFGKQYYVQAVSEADGTPSLYLHTGETFLGPDITPAMVAAAAAAEGAEVQRMAPGAGGAPGTWTFHVAGTGFEADLEVSLEREA